MAGSHAASEINVVACESCRTKKCKCDRKLPTCTQCTGSGIQCTYPESNKRGFPPGYIAALERRLLETELALFDALHSLSLLQSSSHNGRADSNSPSRETQLDVDINKALTKRNATQTKAEKIAEWERLPLASIPQQRDWLVDKMLLVGSAGETSTQQSNLGRRSHFQRSLSSSEPQQHQQHQHSFMPSELAHHPRPDSFSSHDGRIEGTLARTDTIMMPPPSRQAQANWATSQIADEASSARYPSHQTSIQASTDLREQNVVAGITMPSAWPQGTGQDQSPMDLRSAGGEVEDVSPSAQTPGGSRAQRLSSTQWRRFF